MISIGHVIFVNLFSKVACIWRATVDCGVNKVDCTPKK